MRPGIYHILVIVSLIAFLVLATESIVTCSRNNAHQAENQIDIDELNDKVQFLLSNDTIYLGRLDSVSMAAVKNAQVINALMFDVNRAIHYISNEVGIAPDSVWAYVIEQRELRAAKAQRAAAQPTPPGD